MKTIDLEEVVMKEPIRPPDGSAPHVWNDYWRDKKAYNDWVKGKSNGEAKPEPEPPLEKKEKKAKPEKPVAPEHAHSKPAEVVTLKTKAKTPSGGDVLGELNEVWSVIVDGGKTRVHRATETEIAGQKRWISETLTVADFRNAYANRSVRVGKSEVDLGKWWINHPNRRQYLGGLVLWPGADKVPDDKLNLWRGWGVEPRKGDWSLMRQHIAEVIASGDAEHNEYVLNFLAFAVQYPDHQAEAALVLIGGKGCGKGVLGDAMRRLFGQHGLHISSPSHLTGRFNAHLRDCCFLFADESYWAGDKAATGALQRLITEPTLSIEGKDKDLISAPNMLHVMIAAEEGLAVPAGKRERRYVILNVSAKRQQDKAYFDALYAQLNVGGYSAMLYDLLRRDIKGFHPRQIIKTDALSEQQALNLDALEAWWVELLEDGTLPGGTTEKPHTAPSSDYETPRGNAFVINQASSAKGASHPPP